MSRETAFLIAKELVGAKLYENAIALLKPLEEPLSIGEMDLIYTAFRKVTVSLRGSLTLLAVKGSLRIKENLPPRLRIA